MTNPSTCRKPSCADAHRTRACGRAISPPVLVIVLAVICILIHCHYVSAQNTSATEYEIKAAYLYNFGKFIEWPTNALEPNSFSICVLGQDPFGSSLDSTISSEAIFGKRVVVKRILRPQEAAGCRIVYISLSEESRLEHILASLDRASVLTVSDISDFTQHGGMIEFVVRGNRVRFQINLPRAQRAGLAVSSQLLRVAISQPGG